MQSIDIKRFGQTILWSIISEKKKLINNFIGCFLFYVIAITITMGIFTGYRDGLNMIQYVTAASICIAGWVIYGGYYTAELFSNLRTKNSRAQFFLLPATNCEKYWSRLLLALGKGLILSTVALIVADLVQMAISLCFCGDAMSVSKNILQGMFDTEGLKAFAASITGNGGVLDAIFSCAAALWLVSVYVLGGTFLRKAPAVLTTLFIFFGGIALSLAFAGIAWLLFGNGEYEVEFWWDTEATVECVAIFFALAFTIFNIWLSYHKFCRMQII